MDKMSEFKEFVKDKPFLKDKVDNGETSWQELYEKYDIYGEDDEVFKEKGKEEKTTKQNSKKNDDSFSTFVDLLSGIDIDKITEGLNGMKKVLSILSEVTAKDESTSFSKRKMNQPYNREDD